jgi:hypothetical protein
MVVYCLRKGLMVVYCLRKGLMVVYCLRKGLRGTMGSPYVIKKLK